VVEKFRRNVRRPALRTRQLGTPGALEVSAVLGRLSEGAAGRPGAGPRSGSVAASEPEACND
jgi:hypothetical protein